MPFDLHPEYPPEGIRRADLEARYGADLVSRTRDMVESVGLGYRPADTISNSMKALALAEYARDRGGHGAVHDRLFQVYWSEGRDIGDTAVLKEVSEAAGLDEAAIPAALGDETLRRRIKESTEAALGVGASGVPAWVIDGKFLVPGAQPHEVFERVLARLGHSPVDS